MTDTEKAALEKRIDELCQENELLRELARGAANEADRLTHDAAALQIENAKLHILCKRMHDHIKDSCDVCDEYYCSSWDEDNECCVFDSYMTELGIEAD